MDVHASSSIASESPELVFPLTLFSRYLQFLARRPISESNLHYRATRIAGMRSLLPVFAAAPQPWVIALSEQLRTLTPANLIRLAPEIHRSLRAFREPALPRGYLACDEQPDAAFFAGVRRILVLIGPAIGIGDEIITFPLARALHEIVSGAHITVASSYPQIWDRVDGVDHAQHYADLHGLLRMVRAGEFDLLLMLDFEDPGLIHAICHEPSVTRYVELALGPRQMLALDRRRLIEWRMPVAEPNFENYYDCIAGMLEWLGCAREDLLANLVPAMVRPLPSKAEELIVFVNPFTSKEDPSERYWGELLCSFLPFDLPMPVHLRLNTGPSLATRDLAFGLARKVEAHHAGRSVRATVPPRPGRPGSILGIGDIFTFADDADLILTADSFPAHAAQLFRRPTVVLGKARTEPWRSPSENSFYFSSVDPLSSVALGIRTLLGDIFSASLAPEPASAAPLQQAMAEVQRLLQRSHLGLDEAARLLHCWAALRDAQAEFLGEASRRSAGYEVLFNDRVYSDLLPTLDPLRASDLVTTPGRARHLRRRFGEWKNSNLAKFVRRSAGALR